ncbi:hypothetical protein [Limnochorda pilosa]|uniref:hypothetical protein n=1 Tax=Limnochorda pilosa TaxID=1555112 RepID=UPI00118762F4|nr:hypothetical protein [Limnochorda pilosa]
MKRRKMLVVALLTALALLSAGIGSGVLAAPKEPVAPAASQAVESAAQSAQATETTPVSQKADAEESEPVESEEAENNQDKGESDGPGGHEDPDGVDVQHEFEGEE